MPAKRKELLGVIVEVSLPGGLDVLAAFKDGTARYINYAEKMLVWETQTPGSTALINKLFPDSRQLLNRLAHGTRYANPFL